MSNKKELYIYIDESGNMDFRKNERYFVICALVLDEFQGISVGKIVKRMIHEKSKTHEIKELHATQMSYDEKVEFFNHIKVLNFKVSLIIVDKNQINKDMFKNKNACFNYFIYLLLDDLLIDADIISLYVTLDDRNISPSSEDSLIEYLEIELLRNEIYNKSIQIKYADSRTQNNLQAVDLFANAVYANFNHNKSYFYSLFLDNIRKIVFIPEKFDIKNKKE